jgi:hypothetical protein
VKNQDRKNKKQIAFFAVGTLLLVAAIQFNMARISALSDDGQDDLASLNWANPKP